ncbi:MAG: zinc ribbon domain-containing protein [Thermoplasmatales archaeon]|nr:MAG: zinc ribbon domain-containing protein [Thermoplasmatales archaeon]
MKGYTKTGLLLLIIYEIIAVIAVIFLYSFWLSFNPENITTEIFSNFFMAIIPGAVIAGIGGLLGLIGAILMLLGRKEFGEKHRKFIFYAILVFVISIVVSVLLAGILMFATFTSLGQTSFPSENPSDMVDFFRNSNYITITAITAPISAALGGLIWIFGLYQLENKTGRIVLFVAYIIMIVTAIAVAISSKLVFENMINSPAFEELLNTSSYSSSAYMQLYSSFPWVGTTAIVSLVGNALSNVLLIIALYIPYKRITSGELVPISIATKSAEPDRICPNCGKAIPFDANICPYCSKKFETYL